MQPVLPKAHQKNDDYCELPNQWLFMPSPFQISEI